MSNLPRKHKTKKQEEALPETKEKTETDLVALIKKFHDKSFIDFMNRHQNDTRTDILKGFKYEMDLKNQAYYFILHYNLLDLFAAYSRKNPVR
jgi:hypothetical protein